jgi:hypothetical protein
MEFHTVGMRLPQSSIQPLFLRAVSITVFLTCIAALPSHARQVTDQLVSSPPLLRYGSVNVGQTESQALVLTNTGQTAVLISSISVGDSEFTVSGINPPMTLDAGQSVTGSVTFSPSSNGWTHGDITITSNAENSSLLVPIEGAGAVSAALVANPSSLAFGQVPVGSSTADSVVVTNSRSSSVTVNSLQILGTGFSVSGPAMPMTLSSEQSITLKISFAPQGAGAAAGSIFLSGPDLGIPVTGNGTAIGQLTVSPGSLNFGSVNVGSSTTQPSSFTATGGSVTISSASSSNSQFTISGVSLPVTVNSGQSVSFDVIFAPTASGADSAMLSFASNASNQGSESLSGTGVLTQYSVNLSWNASTSSVSGYNVYRGTAPGTYSKINSALDANTSYSDSTVASGVTYYYAATSVNSSGQESGYSSPVQVSVP